MNLRSLRATLATAHNASITPQLSVGQVNAICGSADAAQQTLSLVMDLESIGERIQ